MLDKHIHHFSGYKAEAKGRGRTCLIRGWLNSGWSACCPGCIDNTDAEVTGTCASQSCEGVCGRHGAGNASAQIHSFCIGRLMGSYAGMCAGASQRHRPSASAGVLHAPAGTSGASNGPSSRVGHAAHIVLPAESLKNPACIVAGRWNCRTSHHLLRQGHGCTLDRANAVICWLPGRADKC